MANEDRKDFNAMLHKDTDMPKIQIVTDKATVRKYGGDRMFFAPPIAYDQIMRTVPYGKLLTVGAIREHLAKANNADFYRPYYSWNLRVHRGLGQLSALPDETPYWRTLKANGELNSKYPGGIEAQKEKLKAEGHIVIQKGRTNIRYYVQDYEKSLFKLEWRL